MPDLTFIRHGETTDNHAGTFMGHRDSLCDPMALARATELRRSFSTWRVTHLFSSPLVRCTATAEAAFPNVPYRTLPNLIERDLGFWSGISKRTARKHRPEAFLANGKLDPRFTPPGGESIDIFLARVFSFIEWVASFGEAEHTVAISHNGVILASRCLLEALPLVEVFSKNAPHLEPETFDLNRRRVEIARQHLRATCINIPHAMDCARDM